MPTALATVSKATFRKELAWRVGSWLNGTTSSAGAAGGTTFVMAGLSNYGDDFFKDQWALLTSGGSSGEWRQITAYASSTGTFTVAPAFSAQVASSVTFELHKMRPDLYTLACNQAIRSAYPSVYRPVGIHVLVDSDNYEYGLPRGMRDVLRALYEETASEAVDDNFDRADSTTTPGGDYTEVVGNWGISSNRLYAQSNANGDLLVRATSPNLKNGLIESIVTGVLNSGTDYRTPALVFRYLDVDNYLRVRLLNGVVALIRRSGGADTSLTTATVTTSDDVNYVVRVQFIGVRIKVWVDDVELINYELQGRDLIYRTYGNVGFRLDLAGSPSATILSRWDNYRAHRIESFVERNDWRQDPDRLAIRFDINSYRALSLTSDRWLFLEGRGLLSLLAEDSTYGTLASDSTAVLEIETAEPAWETLLQWAGGYLYRAMSQPGMAPDAGDSELYAEKAQEWLTLAAAMSQTKPMPQANREFMYPA